MARNMLKYSAMRKVAFLVLLGVVAGRLVSDEIEKGKIMDRVVCRDAPGQSYALYIPPEYDPVKKWPILYAFDPGGRGREPLIRFKDGAEARGFIVAGSNNSRNGPWKPIFEAAAAIWEDTRARLSIDDDRVFVAGFSGGARAAALFPKMVGRPVAGVIACGAGLAEGTGGVDNLEAAAFCGIAGTADFNYREVMELDALLDRHADIPHWFRTFDGGHVWPPAPVCAEALEWLELTDARRRGLMPDRTLANGLIAKTAARTAALEAAGSVFRAVAELEAAVSAFEDLGDTGELVARAARLRATGDFKKSSKKEAERARAEEALRTELYKTLVTLEKTEILRRDLSDLFAEIDRLVRDEKSAPDTADKDHARRVLLNVAVHASDQGTALLEAKAFSRAILCFELAVRASGYDPARRRVMLYNLACAHARNGNVRMALDSLRQAVASGFSDKALILRDPDLAAIRDRPEFREIVGRIR